MQDGLRLNAEELERMHVFVRNGGTFDKASLQTYDNARTGLIAISKVPSADPSNATRAKDGHYYFIRDGLHRCCVISLSRDHLRDGEYVIEDRAIEDFALPNFECGWVTPFDPRRQVRKNDFYDYKKRVLSMIGNKSESEIFDYIFSHVADYCTERQWYTMDVRQFVVQVEAALKRRSNQ